MQTVLRKVCRVLSTAKPLSSHGMRTKSVMSVRQTALRAGHKHSALCKHGAQCRFHTSSVARAFPKDLNEAFGKARSFVEDHSKKKADELAKNKKDIFWCVQHRDILALSAVLQNAEKPSTANIDACLKQVTSSIAGLNKSLASESPIDKIFHMQFQKMLERAIAVKSLLESHQTKENK